MTRRGWLGKGVAALAAIAVLLAIVFWAFRRDGNLPSQDVRGEDASAADYAELDTNLGIALERDAEQPDRLLVVYTPTSAGRVAVSGPGGKGDAEYSDRVAPGEEGEDHEFAWPDTALKPGDTIRVTFRRGRSLAHEELQVPGRAPQAGGAAIGLYARRTMADRTEWIGRYGGSAASEEVVGDGLEWLARHQADDGSWSNECLGAGHPGAKCEAGSPCSGPGGPYEMALTGLAVLAFQAGGHYDFNANRYSDRVQRALDWMVGRQGDDGGLLGSKQPLRRRHFYQQYMYEHAIGTFALADACAVAEASRRPKNPRYVQAVERALRFIYRMQHSDGGWRYSDQLEMASDTSVTGWPVLALKSAREAGIAPDPDCVKKVRGYFEARATGEHGRTGYVSREPATEATTGVGMLARQFLLDEPDAPTVREAADYLADYAERTWPDRSAGPHNADYYLWYNCTLAMFRSGGEAWKRWNDVVRDTIVKLQRHEGCPRGSWDPDSKWGHEGGRIYATALAVLTLEVYYRYANPSEAVEPSGRGGPGTPFPLIRRKQ